ncbi:MAG: YigZ family protein [Bacteroidota bacterium]|jgi:uncharacterized YigZ family protein
MNVIDEKYYSISRHFQSQSKIEGSKFIADIFPIVTEEEAEKYLQKIRNAYFDATHHCFAFACGPERKNFRYSDDGEPSGTAGVKIFSAVQSSNLSDVLIIVTRYFGGTKLGVGGLGRAYFESAKKVIDDSTIVEKFLFQEILLSFSFSDTNPVMNIIHKMKIKILQTTYEDDKAHLSAAVLPSSVDHCTVSLTNATNGRIEISFGAKKTIIV